MAAKNEGTVSLQAINFDQKRRTIGFFPALMLKRVSRFISVSNAKQ